MQVGVTDVRLCVTGPQISNSIEDKHCNHCWCRAVVLCNVAAWLNRFNSMYEVNLLTCHVDEKRQGLPHLLQSTASQSLCVSITEWHHPETSYSHKQLQYYSQSESLPQVLVWYFWFAFSYPCINLFFFFFFYQHLVYLLTVFSLWSACVTNHWLKLT